MSIAVRNLYLPVRFLAAMLAAVCFLFVAPRVWAGTPDTALIEYVNAVDPSYSYTLSGAPIVGNGFKLYVVYMNSQQWRAVQEVDRTQWSHWMAIIVPDQVATDTGMLFIAGGDNLGGPDLGSTEVAVAGVLATSSRSIVTVLGQIPNQPLFFSDEAFSHVEDEIIAYSWDRAMTRLDWQWPAYLPMTKAAVRAMDTVQQITSSLSAPPVTRFVVTGFSKRGATTWLTAAVDPRVRAIAPGVFDVLNLDDQIEHHFSAYGAYSSAIDDYARYHLLRRFRTPEGQALQQIVDPLAYRNVLSMPKFLINSPGDQFFLPDSARFYFDQLPGERLMRYVANTDHGLSTESGDVSDALFSLLGWYLGIVYEPTRPNLDWRHENGQLVVQTDRAPLVARLWQAHNPNARDFRVSSIGRSWQSSVVLPVAPGRYRVDVPVPAQGWSAYYLDFIFAGVANVPQTYSTAVFVSPDTLPFKVIDPLGNPRGVGYWRRRVNEAVQQANGGGLDGYFPIPLFDRSLRTLRDAAEILNADPNHAEAQAKMHCLTVRLNVADQQLGWYTPLRLHKHSSKPLWQLYGKAHDAYLSGDAKRAKVICAEIYDR